ncbi:G2 and S phase-expressed protein 1 isoform X2 [Pleurodeles waltl]|uniref:G2 and S phase-expressed protein 1 isoform X2 n=1 Tax=Pleurodeles waltl TaxID=8319 RepID=UPI003709AED1
MNSAPKSVLEMTLLTDEQFDFDLSLSPSSGKEDAEDDEVFIGPIGHKEKCVSVCVDAQKSETDENCPLKPNDQAPWSPLSGDKFVEIFKEAHLLALQLEKSRDSPLNKVTQSAVKNAAIEKFVQESKSKLNIFQSGLENAKTPVPIKRETYCVNDSPFNLLPPSIQQRLEFPVEKTCPSPTRSSPSRCKPSPLKAKTPRKTSVLPTEAKEKTNELQSAKRPTAVEKKVTLSKLQSTKAVSNASKPQHLGVPKFGIRKPQLKLPAHPVPVVPVRKNTSSSSSSQSSINSSMNSSLSVSPVGLNATSLNTSMGNSRSLSNTSLNMSMNSSRLPCSSGRIPMARRNSRPTSTLQTNSSDASRKMYKSNSASKLPDLRINSKPASFAATHPPTPAIKIKKQASDSNLQRISLPSKPPSAVKGNTCSKPKAIIAPTPSSQPKLSRSSGASAIENQVPKIMQPKRLLTGNGSGVAACTPLRPSSVGTQQNSSVSARAVCVLSSTKRASALPTPFGRKLSAIPTMTPKTLPRSFSSPHLLDPELTKVSSNKASEDGNDQAADLQSPESSHPKSSSSEGEVASPKVLPFTLDFSPDRSETAVAAQTECHKSNEVFLLDIGIDKTTALILKPVIKPLIDLSNTPVSRKRSSSLKSETLIDLTSPLILLSPDKENQESFSPLVTF